jgi:thymidylate synthase ThyX
VVQEKVGIQKDVKICEDENGNCKIYYSSESDTKQILGWLYSEPMPLFFAKKMFRASKNCSEVLNILKESVYLYAKEFGFVIDERFITEHSLNNYLFGMYWSQRNYKTLNENGWKPEDARQVLPIATRSQIVVGANIREWRHIFTMRCDKFAHWEIRGVMLELLKWCQTNIPIVFDDFRFFRTDTIEYARKVMPSRNIAERISESGDFEGIVNGLSDVDQLKLFEVLKKKHWR